MCAAAVFVNAVPIQAQMLGEQVFQLRALVPGWCLADDGCRWRWLLYSEDADDHDRQDDQCHDYYHDCGVLVCSLRFALVLWGLLILVVWF